MIRESDIRKRLSGALSGSRALWDFADWLNSASWNMHQNSSQPAVDLAMLLHQHFAEYDAGAFSENELLQKLRNIANNVHTSISYGVVYRHPIEATAEASASIPVVGRLAW
jgi:hypothetical protein